MHGRTRGPDEQIGAWLVERHGRTVHTDRQNGRVATERAIGVGRIGLRLKPIRKGKGKKEEREQRKGTTITYIFGQCVSCLRVCHAKKDEWATFLATDRIELKVSRFVDFLGDEERKEPSPPIEDAPKCASTPPPTLLGIAVCLPRHQECSLGTGWFRVPGRVPGFATTVAL
jgi:hypothetical protein